MCAMKIMHTMASEAIARRPKRRFYSPEVKTQVVAEGQAQSASVAGRNVEDGGMCGTAAFDQALDLDDIPREFPLFIYDGRHWQISDEFRREVGRAGRSDAEKGAVKK